MTRSLDTVLHSIADKYEVLQKLGEGGMGAVYQVRHRLLDQLRVVKVMRPQLDHDDSFGIRFKREAKVAAALRHPHIATLHDFDVTPEDSAYIVMEYVQGETFQALLRRERPPVELAVELAKQALEALAYLHRKGFVHRDISPDNLMYHREPTRGPQVVLIDLGIAKRLGEEAEHGVTQAGTFLGKVKYGSPEQFSAEFTPSPASDVYSFGLVFYELLTGRHPIEGKTNASLIAGHVYRPPLPFAESDPDGRIPEAIRAVALKALSKDPKDRYQNAAEMATALEAATGRTVGADATGGSAMEAETAAAPAPARPAPVSTPKVTSTDETRVLDRPEPIPDIEAPAVRRRRARTYRRWLVPALGLLVAAAAGALIWWLTPREPRIELPADFEIGPRYAVVIGNNDYATRGRGLPSLISAVPDARAVARELRTRHGYTVELLENAERNEVAEALYALPGRLGADHNLIIFYAGHGEIDPHGNGYWLPVDADASDTSNWFANKEIDDLLFDVAAKRVLVIADSCFSGTLAPVQDSVDEELASQDRSELFEKPAHWALTSGGTEPVLDTSRGGDHSLFTGALLEELRQEEGVLTSAQVFRQIRKKLEPAQEPRRAPLRGHEGGEFLFVPEIDAESQEGAGS